MLRRQMITRVPVSADSSGVSRRSEAKVARRFRAGRVHGSKHSYCHLDGGPVAPARVRVRYQRERHGGCALGQLVATGVPHQILNVSDAWGLESPNLRRRPTPIQRCDCPLARH